MGTDRIDRLIPWAMVALVTAVAVFAFVQSYTHIFSLGQMHHQTGASLRMLPLSVDWLMLAAGLVMLHLGRQGIKHPLPRGALALGATATLTANIADGIIWGWESAAINSWAPIVLFTVVELGMLVVRKAKPKPKAEEQPMGIVTFQGEVSPETIARVKQQLTELREPQATPEPSGNTTTMQAVTDSPPVAGWGQLAGEPAGQGTRLGRQEPDGGLTGIGLANGRK